MEFDLLQNLATGFGVALTFQNVLYALAGAVNPETGWGLTGDTFAVVDQLQRFGYERWFNLGDKDLAMAIHRTRLIHAGVPMHEIVAGLARAAVSNYGRPYSEIKDAIEMAGREEVHAMERKMNVLDGIVTLAPLLGLLGTVTGLIKNANSTCLIGKPFKRDLEAALQREVRIANDANCFALSEAIDGAGAGAQVMFGVMS